MIGKQWLKFQCSWDKNSQKQKKMLWFCSENPVQNKLQLVLICFWDISSHQHWNFKVLISTLHYNPIIMGRRGNNFQSWWRIYMLRTIHFFFIQNRRLYKSVSYIVILIHWHGNFDFFKLPYVFVSIYYHLVI